MLILGCRIIRILIRLIMMVVYCCVWIVFLRSGMDSVVISSGVVKSNV